MRFAIFSLFLSFVFCLMPVQFAAAKGGYAAHTVDAVVQLERLIAAQEPFFMFPEEDNNGEVKYLEVSHTGCLFRFRDSVSLRTTSGLPYRWVHTRQFHLGRLREVRFDERSGPNYYAVLFGGTARFPILVLDAETSYGDEVKRHENYAVFDSFLRFKKRSDAEYAVQLMLLAGEACKNRP